jgi:hypothetical protein
MILAWFDRRRIAVDEHRVGALARLVDITGAIDSPSHFWRDRVGVLKSTDRD